MAHDKDTPPSTLSANATDLQARYGHHLEGKALSETQQQEDVASDLEHPCVSC